MDKLFKESIHCKTNGFLLYTEKIKIYLLILNLSQNNNNNNSNKKKNQQCEQNVLVFFCLLLCDFIIIIIFPSKSVVTQNT